MFQIVVLQSRAYEKCGSNYCTNNDQIVVHLTTIALDEMGNRIDELEQSIKELKAEIGAEDSPLPDSSSNSKPEGKPDETSE
ncbi:unnamed protein product [Amaranthus hypochondriacus]